MLVGGFFRHHGDRADAVSLWGGDAVGGTQAGTHPPGLDRCCARWSGKPVPGLACFAWSLRSIPARRAFPGRVEPVSRRDAEPAARKAQAAAKKGRASRAKRRPGRPKGRQNNNKADVLLTPELGRSKSLIEALRPRIAACLPVTSLVLAGPLGHRTAWRTAHACHGPLIAQRRADSAWSWPDDGPDAGPGPRRKDGSQGDATHLPQPCLKEPPVDGPLQTRVSQAQLLPQACAPPCHVVLIVPTNRRTQAQAHGLFFRRDLPLASTSLGDYDGLRFPIAWNFRDAKQSWGLEDCMHVTPTGVTNAAHRSWFLVHVASRRQADRRQPDPDESILDVQADCRGSKYVEEMRQRLPEKPEPILLRQMRNKGACLGRMHAVQPSCSLA